MPYFLVNRLDRDTSGLIVIAKSSRVCGEISGIFSSRNVEKSYFALCVGDLPEWKEKTVKTGHGKSRFGLWRVYSPDDIGRKLPFGSKVKEMITTFQVIRKVDRIQCFQDGEFFELPSFLIKATLLTGRTHQIRLHCQYLGFPILGDMKYGGPQKWRFSETIYDSHALHSSVLEFLHPHTQGCLCLQCPLPAWAQHSP